MGKANLFSSIRKLATVFILTAICAVSIAPAFAYDPESVKSYNLGVDASKEGNFSDAITYFKKAIILDPTFTDAYYNLGSVYEYLGDTSKAIDAYKELLKRNPEDGETAYKIAQLYYKRHEYSKSLGYLYLISTDSPKYAESQTLYKSIMKTINQTNASDQQSKVVVKGFKWPTGITKDSKGNLYVANYGISTITKISAEGQRTVFAKGKPLNGPIGLVSDAADNIYCANYLSGEIVKITPNGVMSSYLKGITKPYYLYIDKTGNLYISEQATNTVIRVKLK